jgi:plastocyanin
VFGGPPPQRQPYNVTKDPQICTEGGRPPLQETHEVNSGNNGIKNVAVYLRRASRVHESLQASAEPAEFDQKTCQFLPHVFATMVGRTIQFKNSDPVGHNVKFGGFNETIESGRARDYAPQGEDALPVQVSCSIHPWMAAWFLARSNPYVALTKDDGSFELANLPAGEPLEFQVWHESASGTGNALVPGTPETRDLKWTTRGRFTITLQPDEVKEISITVPASAFRAI